MSSHSPPRASLSTSFLSPFAGNSLSSDFSGHKLRPSSLPQSGVVSWLQTQTRRRHHGYPFRIELRFWVTSAHVVRLVQS